MKRASVLSALLASVFSLSAFAAEYGFEPRPSCARPTEAEDVLHTEDFKWGYALPEMGRRFEEIYAGSKRLRRRAYYDSSRGQYVMEFGGKPVVLPPRFVKSVIRHIEIALSRRYADHVFFPDMGHSHFYFPAELKDRLTDYPVDQFDRLYQGLVNEPKLKVLYHTGEQLQMLADDGSRRLLEDREIQWRYFSRNVIGDTVGGESAAPHFAWGSAFNTLSELEGHESWSSGFNLSANREGCFPYRKGDKTYWFDLSWYDLEPGLGGAE